MGRARWNARVPQRISRARWRLKTEVPLATSPLQVLALP